MIVARRCRGDCFRGFEAAFEVIIVFVAREGGVQSEGDGVSVTIAILYWTCCEFLLVE